MSKFGQKSALAGSRLIISKVVKTGGYGIGGFRTRKHLGQFLQNPAQKCGESARLGCGVAK